MKKLQNSHILWFEKSTCETLSGIKTLFQEPEALELLGLEKTHTLVNHLIQDPATLPPLLERCKNVSPFIFGTVRKTPSGKTIHTSPPPSSLSSEEGWPHARERYQRSASP